MVQGEGFKHISVTAPEEDDVVIIAGVKEPVDATSDDDAKKIDGSAEIVDAVDDGGADEAARGGETLQPKEASSKTAKQAAPPKKPQRNKDEYHETTLEDLEHTPMPFAQRVVIVAAIICIIGAVIYCLAFMG